jgi:hypothetical protein
MLHRIRKAMECASPDKFDGTTETDTTYVGGRADNMHEVKRIKAIQGRGAVGKVPVHGILQRGTETESSRVNAEVIGEENADSVLSRIKQIVTRGVPVYSDEARVYDTLINDFAHKAIDHSVAYVRGMVHTNGIENFWSLLKRSIKGTYVSVAPYHLFRYVAEQVFRFNSRKWTDADRFGLLLSQVFGRRLTYRLVAGIDDAGFMGKQ